jgi:hypothetical protein
VHPDCVDADNASGQWTKVPEPFATVQGVSGRCVCKKAACRRWCGLKDEKWPPGRKRAASEEAGASAAGTSSGVLPRPPWIRSIDQIWGVRCGVHALACDFPHISRPLPSCLVSLLSLFSLFSLRYADIDDLDEVTRSNLLPYPPAGALEYAVHGKYARTADDSNGVWGTWYIGLRELVQVFGKDEVAAKLAEFEAELKEAREEALEDIEIEEREEQEEAAAPAQSSQIRLVFHRYIRVCMYVRSVRAESLIHIYRGS